MCVCSFFGIWIPLKRISAFLIKRSQLQKTTRPHGQLGAAPVAWVEDHGVHVVSIAPRGQGVAAIGTLQSGGFHLVSFFNNNKMEARDPNIFNGMLMNPSRRIQDGPHAI